MNLHDDKTSNSYHHLDVARGFTYSDGEEHIALDLVFWGADAVRLCHLWRAVFGRQTGGTKVPTYDAYTL